VRGGNDSTHHLVGIPLQQVISTHSSLEIEMSSHQHEERFTTVIHPLKISRFMVAAFPEPTVPQALISF
jgi:hypothetical protein